MRLSRIETTPASDGFKPELVGQLVSIRILPRVGKDEVDTRNMRKYTGKLSGYVTKEHETGFFIEGISEPFYVSTVANLIEVYEHKVVY